jgi:DNA-binding response OmpR family regulator
MYPATPAFAGAKLLLLEDEPGVRAICADFLHQASGRVQVLLRRGQPATSGLTLLHFGDITVDLREHSAFSMDGPVALTRAEFALLELLARHYGRPVASGTILDALRGHLDRPTFRTVETQIWCLRGKLGDGGEESRWIRTVPGAGYQLECDPQPVAA